MRRCLVLAVGCLLACHEITAAEPMSGLTRFDPPDDYATYWTAMEACSGTTGDLARVQWYTVPGTYFTIPGDTTRYAGYWFARTNSIVLGADNVDYRPLVEHEMLHAILHRGDHPHVFVECGVGP